MTRIKICGLTRPEDVDAVNAARPDFCGFIVDFPKSRRNVSHAQLRALRERLDGAVVPVGVFVDAPPKVVAALQNDGTITVAQLHGHESGDYIAALRALTGGKPVWKAYRVRTPADIGAARRSTADRVLLDNGTGTGRVFDWALVGEIGRPWVLAGGLTPENLQDAVCTLRPWGVDLSSGVESGGVKDAGKISAAVAAVRKELGHDV